MLKNKKIILFIFQVQSLKIYLKLFLILFFLIPTSFLKTNPLIIEDENYEYSTKRGWDELNNLHHFENAKKISENAIEIINNSNDSNLKVLLPEWENKLHATKNRIETYKELKSNAFPIGPLLSNSYVTHHLFNPGFKTAVELTMNEVREVLRQISTQEGQVSVLFVQKGTHHPEVEEIAYRNLSGFPYYNTIPMEDHINLFGKILTFEMIDSNPDILSGYFKNEKWEYLYVISIEKLKVHKKLNFNESIVNTLIQKLYYSINDKISLENEAFYNISIHKYSKNEKEKFFQIAVMNSTGVYTGEYFNTSFLQAMILGVILFIIILHSIFYSSIRKIYRDKLINNLKDIIIKNKTSNDEFTIINPVEEKNKHTFLDNFDLKQFGKLFANSLLFLFLGLGFSFGIGIGSEVIIGSWTENIGSLEFKSFGVLFILNFFIYPILLIILFKIADYVIVVKQKLILPILFISFSLGIALYMNLYIEFYNKLSNKEGGLFFVVIFFLFTLLNGFILAEVYKETIDLNSKKRFFYFDKNGDKIDHPPFRLLLRFGVYILLILMCNFYGALIFYNFLKMNISTLIHYLLPLSMCLVLLAIKITKKDFQIPNVNSSINNNIDEFKKPITLDKLLEYLTDPDLIPYQIEKINHIPEIHSALISCMEKEGGIILISGGKWSGKKRIIKEVLKNSHFQRRTEFNILCTSKVESKFLPFIEGMKNIPQIESILKNIEIGKNTKKAADMLSNIFSVVPIAGGLISKFLESDIDFTSKENEKYLLDTLATTVQEISLELQTLNGGSNHGGQDRDQILFFLDNFQDVDESTLHVIEKIREQLKKPVISDETNYVAFILFLNNDSRFLREDLFNNSDLLKPIKRFHIQGLDYNSALNYFREKLNFAANRKNDELFSKIFEIYSEEIKIDNEKCRYISPKYIVETIRNEILKNNNYLTKNENSKFNDKDPHRISLISEKFVYNGNPLKISISDTVYKDYTYRIEKLKNSEIEILEVASVLGNRFNISEISYILNIDNITISKKIKNIERDGDILSREDNSGEYLFKKGIYREIFKKRIFSSISFEGDEIPFQLYTEYCNRGVEYFHKKNIKNLSLEEIKRFAHISYYASKLYLKEFITSNLQYASIAYTVPELQIDGIMSLEKIVNHRELKELNKEDFLNYLIENEFLKQFISTLSFYVNDFQELITGNFPYLSPTIEMLYENQNYFYNTFEPELLNHLTATYFFTKKPYDLIFSFNEKALKDSKKEEDVLIANFWKSFLLRVKGFYRDPDPKKKDEYIYNEKLINQSIEILNSIINKTEVIKDEYWRNSYLSRILNNLGQCYQIKFIKGHLQGDRKKALDILNECIKVKNEIKDYTGKAMALSVRYSLQEDFESKKNDLEDGIKANLITKNYNGVAILYEDLEKLMREYKKFNEEIFYRNIKEETRRLNGIKPKEKNN